MLVTKLGEITKRSINARQERAAHNDKGQNALDYPHLEEPQSFQFKQPS